MKKRPHNFGWFVKTKGDTLGNTEVGSCNIGTLFENDETASLSTACLQELQEDLTSFEEDEISWAS
eukprot:4706188-Amphidinium_carterae.1